jgi:hypothetical protein
MPACCCSTLKRTRGQKDRDAEGNLLLKLATPEEAEAAQSSFSSANFSKYAVIFKIPEGADPKAAISAVMKGVDFAISAADIFPIISSSYTKGYRLTCPGEDEFFATLGKIIRVPSIENCETAVVLVGSNRSLVGTTSHIDRNVGEHARQAYAAGVPYAQMFPQYALSGGSGPQGGKTASAKASSSKAAEKADRRTAAAAKDTATKKREGKGSDQDVDMSDASLLVTVLQASNCTPQQCSFQVYRLTSACTDLSLSNNPRVCKTAAAVPTNISAILITYAMHAETDLRNMLHLPRATPAAVLSPPPHYCCRPSRRRVLTEYRACRAPLRSATACTTPATCDSAVTPDVQLLRWHAHTSDAACAGE